MIQDAVTRRFTDHRDLDLLKSFGAPNTTEGLPSQYIVDTLKDMRDQTTSSETLFACTAFSQTELASDQTGEAYDVVEFYQSTPPGGYSGRAMRDSLSLLVKRGPKTLDQKVRPWNGKYYSIYKQGPLDWFDACRVGMFVVRNEKRAVSAAMPWYPQWTFPVIGKDGIVPDRDTYSWTGATAHNAVIAGWTDTGLVHGQPLGDTYLAVKAWMGTRVGDGGWLYFSRPIINKIFNMYYTEMFTASQQKPATFLTVDIPAIERIISYIRNLLSPTPPKPVEPPPQPPVVPQEPPKPVPTVQGDEKLIAALIQVESQGNDNAIGDRNLPDKAYGCLQIRRPYITDANGYLGTTYKAEDCLGNRPLSIKIFRAYMDRYKLTTDEQKARAHNGGPSAARPGTKMYTATNGYWAKVKANLA